MCRVADCPAYAVEGREFCPVHQKLLDSEPDMDGLAARLERAKARLARDRVGRLYNAKGKV